MNSWKRVMMGGRLWCWPPLFSIHKAAVSLQTRVPSPARTSPSSSRMSDPRIRLSVFLFDHNVLQYFGGHFSVFIYFYVLLYYRCITMAASWIPKMRNLREALKFSRVWMKIGVEWIQGMNIEFVIFQSSNRSVYRLDMIAILSCCLSGWNLLWEYQVTHFFLIPSDLT